MKLRQRILVTGCAGFIGFHVVDKLVKKGHIVYGIDNIDDYYDINLKKDKLKLLKKNKNFFYKKIDISNKNKINHFLKKIRIDSILNLAGQAGVRYSIENPRKYYNSNITGFFNLIEIARIKKVRHFISASTSSVYGENKTLPFKENHHVDNIIQFYAASKRSNEIIGQVYSKVYNMKFTFLRFFTVYGPWARPDMSLGYFVSNIIKKKKINVFNMGKHKRDFTYVDDIADGTIKAIFRNDKKNFQIYNLGNGKKIPLMKYIKILEKKLGIKAKISFKKLQVGDIKDTWSCTKKSKKELSYNPKIKIEQGIDNYIKWYRNYYKV